MIGSERPELLRIEEIDALAPQAIDAIGPMRLNSAVREYRTPTSRVLEFGNGARFEVLYDASGEPFDYRATGVRFERFKGRITVSPGN